MMNLRKYSLLVLLTFTLAACNQKKEEQSDNDGSACTPLNPNGDSELALLMRKMAVLSEENAAALRAGKDLVPYDGSFEKVIFSAERSMNVEEQLYQGMAKAYITNLNKLYQAGTTEEKIALHNNVVQSCQDCHSQTCRGPLKRIQKMIVK
jgi:hypothetical protein